MRPAAPHCGYGAEIIAGPAQEAVQCTGDAFIACLLIVLQEGIIENHKKAVIQKQERRKDNAWRGSRQLSTESWPSLPQRPSPQVKSAPADDSAAL